MSFQHIDTQTGASGVPSPNSSPNPTATSKKSSMGATDDKLKALLPTKILVDQLVVVKTKQSLLVRILRMWEAKNFKLNGVILSLDLLMLDEKDNLIQCSIYYRRIHMFKEAWTLRDIARLQQLQLNHSHRTCKVKILAIFCNSLFRYYLLNFVLIIVFNPNRFRVELIVECEERTTTFVLFNRDAKRIAQSTAENLTNPELLVSRAAPAQFLDAFLLLSVVGKTFAFQNVKNIKIEDGNVQPTFFNPETSKESENQEEPNGDNEAKGNEGDVEQAAKKMRVA